MISARKYSQEILEYFPRAHQRARHCHERPARAGAADEARTNIGAGAAHNDLLNNPLPCARCVFRPDFFVTRSAA
jgi:hypothetical protein